MKINGSDIYASNSVLNNQVKVTILATIFVSVWEECILFYASKFLFSYISVKHEKLIIDININSIDF